MKPFEVVNRGGSEFSDLDEYAKRIVVAYKPKAVVVYEGDNDLSQGSPKTPESVANDFKKFVQSYIRTCRGRGSTSSRSSLLSCGGANGPG